ncbi:putative 2OG-Fe(II) oxygenase family oxidoreductase [Lindgomyces ingoldianus]|uniref:2OG-Fe(II) oxygenase family oxidoreductase n=1 Tax=Lindgomyces ingoldianus TaxID=673940 RepID=A0ACB6QUT3_9PLEO|nr:putative 2OG-Fe(II) oxygenase family oxidoreductase [Lindgomyces ingoldianus]KAF2470759.1 putative 2OG-Fe(II) oxygenase family oxidoreductase [Lindgomyces ingoldianus]
MSSKEASISTNAHKIHLQSPSPCTGCVVPTIDIGPYLSDPTSSEARQLIDTIRAACVKTGFFQITGHGVSRDLQDSAIDAAKEFFALPIEEKEKLDIEKNIGFRGYDKIGTQSYSASSAPDLKESFFIGTDISIDDPRVQAGRILTGPNVWPDDSILHKSWFREPVEMYYAAVRELGSRVMEMIGQSLTSNPEQFHSFLSNQPAVPLRLLHYPKASLESTERKIDQFGCGAHTDFGAITLLLQDQNAGLQLFSPETNEWFTIPPRSDTYVVNVGDMLSSITGGKYKSSWHRVLKQTQQDRYSIALFMHGNLDFVLNPINGSSWKEPLTVEQYLLQRIMSTYSKDRVTKVNAASAGLG